MVKFSQLLSFKVIIRSICRTAGCEPSAVHVWWESPGRAAVVNGAYHTWAPKQGLKRLRCACSPPRGRGESCCLARLPTSRVSLLLAEGAGRGPGRLSPLPEGKAPFNQAPESRILAALTQGQIIPGNLGHVKPPTSLPAGGHCAHPTDQSLGRGLLTKTKETTFLPPLPSKYPTYLFPRDYPSPKT